MRQITSISAWMKQMKHVARHRPDTVREPWSMYAPRRRAVQSYGMLR